MCTICGVFAHLNTKLLFNGLENMMVQSTNAWNKPRTKLMSVNVPNYPIQGDKNIGAMEITWDQVNEMKRKVNIICRCTNSGFLNILTTK